MKDSWICQNCDVKHVRYVCSTCKTCHSRCSQCHFNAHQPGDPVHEFHVTESAVSFVCADAREYMESTLKEFEIPLSGDCICDMKYNPSAMKSLARLQSELAEKINLPLETAFNSLLQKKLEWKKHIVSRFSAYRDDHEKQLLCAHQKLLNTVIPLASRLEQLSRETAELSTDNLSELSMCVYELDEYVNRKSIHQKWMQEYNKLEDVCHPVPRITIPDKVTTAIQLLQEGIAEMDISFDEISPQESLSTKTSDWFSSESLQPRVSQSYFGSLVGNISPDGELTLRFCGNDLSSWTSDEVCDILTNRLKSRLITADPSLRLLDLDDNISVDMIVAVCRKHNSGLEVYRGKIEIVDFVERQCSIFLIDFGRAQLFTFEEIYGDYSVQKNVANIPPLTLSGRLFFPKDVRANPEIIEAEILKLQSNLSGCFPFQIVAEDCTSGKVVREIIIFHEANPELGLKQDLCVDVKSEPLIKSEPNTETSIETISPATCPPEHDSQSNIEALYEINEEMVEASKENERNNELDWETRSNQQEREPFFETPPEMMRLHREESESQTEIKKEFKTRTAPKDSKPNNHFSKKRNRSMREEKKPNTVIQKETRKPQGSSRRIINQSWQKNLVEATIISNSRLKDRKEH